MAALPLFDFGAVNIEPWMPPAIVPAAPRKAERRWFVRCVDCLTIAAVTEPPNTYDWRCSACDGRIESMGRVERDRLVHEHTASVCDDRCTNARGPKCDCKCGGENHGSKRTVRIIRDAGPVPKVNMASPEHARRLAHEYREARTRALAQLDDLRDRRRRGEYLPRLDFERMRALQLALQKTHEARDHKSRMRTLNAVTR